MPDEVPVKLGLRIDDGEEATQLRAGGQHAVTVAHWVDEEFGHHIMVDSFGFATNEEGARGTAEMLRDAAELILVQLGDLPREVQEQAKEQFKLTEPSLGKSSVEGLAEYQRLLRLRRPGETARDVERREAEEREGHAHRTAQRPSIDSYKTPDRVERAREARAKARADRKTFRPHQ